MGLTERYMDDTYSTGFAEAVMLVNEMRHLESDSWCEKVRRYSPSGPSPAQCVGWDLGRVYKWAHEACEAGAHPTQVKRLLAMCLGTYTSGTLAP